MGEEPARVIPEKDTNKSKKLDKEVSCFLPAKGLTLIHRAEEVLPRKALKFYVGLI